MVGSAFQHLDAPHAEARSGYLTACFSHTLKKLGPVRGLKVHKALCPKLRVEEGPRLVGRMRVAVAERPEEGRGSPRAGGAVGRRTRPRGPVRRHFLFRRRRMRSRRRGHF